MNNDKLFYPAVLMAVVAGFVAGYLALCWLHEIWFNHKLADQCKRKVEILYAALEAQNERAERGSHEGEQGRVGTHGQIEIEGRSGP